MHYVTWGATTEAGTMVLCSYSALDRRRRRTQLRRHQPREGALLDSRHQRIVSPLPSHRNPNRCFGQETDAGPTKLRLGMDRRGDYHRGNVRRGHSDVCCVESRSRCRRAVRSAVFVKLIVRTVQFGPAQPFFPGLSFIYRADEQSWRSAILWLVEKKTL
jgi:hypothetical protein